MTNKKLGNDFESDLCDKLFASGFWSHNMAQNQAGQPADIIAARNGKTYLIDCKVCSNRGFALSRMEENQDWSMALWKACGNGVGWFALLLPGERIYMISHSQIKIAKDKKSYLKEEEICRIGIPYYEWIETV